MGDYIEEFAFAKRTIKIYRAARNAGITLEYQFTAILGTLLNVFSCICPDDKFMLNLKPLLSDVDKFPRFREIHPTCNITNLQAYLKNIRNGLAHKTSKNFNASSNESGEILSINISSKGYNGNVVQMNLNDLEIILELLEVEIKKY